MLEDGFIPLLLDMPGCKDHHLSKERFIEFPSSPVEHPFKSIIRLPLNLKVVPNSNTEIAREKHMISIFMNPTGAKHTSEIFSDLPMSSLKQVPCV